MSEVWKRVQSTWWHFSTLQKGIVLAASSVFIGLVGGSWGPLLALCIGLPIASIFARRLLELKRNLDIIKHVSDVGNGALVNFLKLAQSFKAKSGSNVENDGISETVQHKTESENFLTNNSVAGTTPEFEVNQCLFYAKRDFLHSWYSYISDEETFTEEVEELMEQLTMKIMECVRNVNILEIVPDYILIIRKHLLDYQEAMNKLNMQPNVRYKKDRSREFKKIKTVEGAFAHLGKFHIAAKNDGELGLVYLRSLADTIMKVLIPERTYGCYAAKELLLEILTCMVLVTLVDMFCDKDFLHKAMVLILSDDDLLDSVDNESCQASDAIQEKTKDSMKSLQRGEETNPDATPTGDTGEKELNSDMQRAVDILKDKPISGDPQDQNEYQQSGVPEIVIPTDESPDVNGQTSYVNTTDLAKHFKIVAPESLDREGSPQNNSSVSQKVGTPPMSIDVPTLEVLQAEKDESHSLNGSLEDVEEIPAGISFTRSFFIGTDDEETGTSDEYCPSKEGSPSLGNDFGSPDMGNNHDFPDGKIQNGKNEYFVSNGRNSLGDLPLRKAASCEVLSNKNLVRDPGLQISASTTNLVNVGLPGGNDQTPNQLLVDARPSVGKKKPSTQKPPPEPFGTGPVEATSREMPNYLYQDVQVPSTEQTRDPARAIYTLYVIKYRAWHLEDEMWVLRRSVAKRRYREFVTLQERLEEHPIYKKKIKGIKGPQRWRVLAIGNLENHGIESRRKFLERYLQTLIHKDQVGNSLAMREFLAYEEDAHIAFVKKAPEVHVPRIDKIIARTVSGVFNKITKTSSSSNMGPRSQSNPRLRGTHRVPDEVDVADLVDQDAYCLSYGYQHNDQSDVHTMENVLTQHIHQQEYLASIDLAMASESQPPSSAGSEEDEKQEEEGEEEEEFKDPMDSQQSSDSDQPEPPQDKNCHDQLTPLASAVLDLALTLVQERNSWLTRDKVIQSLKRVAGNSLEREEIEDLVTAERWCHYIRLLSSVLWPDGELDTSPTPELTQQQQAMRREQARTCLANFFPAFLPYVVGQEDFSFAVDKVMEVIHHKGLNRHLVYTLLDNAVETLFPEVKTAKIQQELRMLHIQKHTES